MTNLLIRRNRQGNTYNIDVAGHHKLPSICAALSITMTILQEQLQKVIIPKKLTIIKNESDVFMGVCVDTNHECVMVYELMDLIADLLKGIANTASIEKHPIEIFEQKEDETWQPISEKLGVSLSGEKL